MMGRDGSGNVLAPNLSLKLNLLLQDFPLPQRNEELTQVTFLILRNISNLRHVYHFYCMLGHNRVQSTKSDMTRLQFWRFIKDSHIHHHGLSIPEMDRIIARCLEKGSVHQPTERLSLSDFLSSITILGYFIYKDKIKIPKPNGKSFKEKPQSSTSSSGGRSSSHRSQSYILPQCLQMVISDHIMKYSGRVKGGFLYDTRRAINALKYMEGSWKIYRSICDQQCREPTLVMRKLLLALKDFKIIGPHLSTDAFLKILASDNPAVNAGGVYNLEIEITFLEYFEALVGCATTFVNEEMLQQPVNFGAPRLQRKFSSGSGGGRSGLGHSRPGSAYSRHTSARSSRTASSRHSSVTSIAEDAASLMDAQSDISTVKPPNDSPTNMQEVQESMETAISGIDELQIGDSDVQPDRQQVSPSPSAGSLSLLLDDDDEDDDFNAASLMGPRSKGSSPEVISAEMEEKERQFTIWSNQLHIFFTRHLFPAWQKLEILRREAAKHRGRKMGP